jgi:hypothetical protein
MRKRFLDLLIGMSLVLVAGTAMAYTLHETFDGAAIHQSDLTTAAGLNQWNDVSGWTIQSSGGNSWVQQGPTTSDNTNLLFYGFDATGLGAGTTFTLQFDYINQIGARNYAGVAYLGGLDAGESISRFAPWNMLPTTNFWNTSIPASTNTDWTTSSLLSGTVDADHEVLYIAFRMGGIDGLRAIDNIHLTVGENGSAPVPEPATLLLLGAGIAGVAFMRRRARI